MHEMDSLKTCQACNGFLMLSKQLQPLQILARHLSARPFTLQSSLSLGVAYCNDQLLKTFKQRFRNRIVESFGDKFKTRQRDRNRLSTPGKPLPQLLGKEWHKGVKQVWSRLKNSHQIDPRRGSLRTFRGLRDLRLDPFEIPVAKLMPEKVIDDVSRLVEPKTCQRFIHLAGYPAEA